MMQFEVENIHRQKRYLWNLAWICGRHGDLRIILKDSLKHVPIIGKGLMRVVWASCKLWLTFVGCQRLGNAML